MPFEMGGDKFPQFGVRAAAAFVFQRLTQAAHDECEAAITRENGRHETELRHIRESFYFTVSEGLAQYRATHDATSGDDDDATNED